MSPNSSCAWTRRDLVAGTAIAVLMGTAFTRLSSGRSLIVTFLPGLAVAWLCFLRLYATRAPLPDGNRFLPPFFSLLAVQFLHFAEEFATGFARSFPGLYGGAPYAVDLFVVFNMFSYFIFTMACLLTFTRGLRFLLVPVLFFIVYGALGNAISHTWWSLYTRSYFPGLGTAQLYWVLGPMVLHTLMGRRRDVAVVVLLLAAVLVWSLTFFITPGGPAQG